MYKIPSKIEGKNYALFKLEQLLKPLGYTIGGNWDYDQGYFDYKMADDDGYKFLRIPFVPTERQLDDNGAVVELQTPFVLNHVYQEDLDDHADIGNLSASIDQFAEPKDQDGDVDKKYIEMGQELVRQLEYTLLGNND